jgi:hypothetical protein
MHVSRSPEYFRWTYLIAIYARLKKKTIILIGEILSAPRVPALTSTLVIAEMARRNRSAIKGAVTKFIGNLSCLKEVFGLS